MFLFSGEGRRSCIVILNAEGEELSLYQNAEGEVLVVHPDGSGHFVGQHPMVRESTRLGSHRKCGGTMFLRPASEKYVSLNCGGCNFRTLIPKEVCEGNQLQSYFSERIHAASVTT